MNSVYLRGSLTSWFLFAIFMSAMQASNEKMNIWQNKKGGLASWLLYAIIIIILLAVLILALRFLFNVI